MSPATATAFPLAEAHITLVKWCQDRCSHRGLEVPRIKPLIGVIPMDKILSLPKTRLQMRMKSVTSGDDADSSCFSSRMGFYILAEPKRSKYLFFLVDFLILSECSSHFLSLPLNNI